MYNLRSSKIHAAGLKIVGGVVRRHAVNNVVRVLVLRERRKGYPGPYLVSALLVRSEADCSTEHSPCASTHKSCSRLEFHAARVSRSLRDRNTQAMRTSRAVVSTRARRAAGCWMRARGR